MLVWVPVPQPTCCTCHPFLACMQKLRAWGYVPLLANNTLSAKDARDAWSDLQKTLGQTTRSDLIEKQVGDQKPTWVVPPTNLIKYSAWISEYQVIAHHY
jgi:hypothetical protein